MSYDYSYDTSSAFDNASQPEPEVYHNSFPFLTRFAQRQAEGHRLAELRRLSTTDLNEAMMWQDPNDTQLLDNMESCPLYLCESFSPDPISVSPACGAYRKNAELMQHLSNLIDVDFEIPEEGNLI